MKKALYTASVLVSFLGSTMGESSLKLIVTVQAIAALLFAAGKAMEKYEINKAKARKLQRH